MIEVLAKKIHPSLENCSGKVFYSGRSAFAKRSDIYILGFNPGGDPIVQSDETVGSSTNFVLHKTPDLWSAYCDESWVNRPPGTFGMQPRIRHLFQRVGRDPRLTPSSNLIFVRSRRTSTLEDIRDLEDTCWPLHHEVIGQLCPQFVLCLGNGTGDRVRRRLGANTIIGEFVEDNNRRWTSRAFQNSSGLVVLSLTHPSVADWTNVQTDPSPMIRKIIKQEGGQC